MTPVTPVGLDLGNNETDICIFGKVAKIPSRIAFVCPPGQISPRTGQELKINAFKLLFEDDRPFWFGPDTLGGSAIQKLEMSKYDPDHISVLFRAALYQWARVYKTDLSTLGKLNVVASMPPGLFKNQVNNKAATTAFRKAFNRSQSHVKVKDGKTTTQIVTQFGGLERECVGWGQDLPQKGKLVLTVDLGGGTNDYVLFNGSPEPVPPTPLTDNKGLLHAYQKINPNDIEGAEMKVLRDKKKGLPHQLVTFYNEVERRIQMITAWIPKSKLPLNCIYIIGGGAALMTPTVKATFTPLAEKVIVKDEYANARANWVAAGGEDEDDVS